MEALQDYERVLAEAVTAVRRFQYEHYTPRRPQGFCSHEVYRELMFHNWHGQPPQHPMKEVIFAGVCFTPTSELRGMSAMVKMV